MGLLFSNPLWNRKEQKRGKTLRTVFPKSTFAHLYCMIPKLSASRHPRKRRRTVSQEGHEPAKP
jgi:hypothetical protein